MDRKSIKGGVAVPMPLETRPVWAGGRTGPCHSMPWAMPPAALSSYPRIVTPATPPDRAAGF